MSELDLARSLYEALAASDGAALAALLGPSYEAWVSDGLPGGGGHIVGGAAMLALWARVGGTFDVAPRCDELLPLEGGGVLALGRYVGRARATGKAVDAAFAHVLRFEGGRLVSLRQITDTQRWAEALHAA